jgi:tetratricopeptide (TPR) repeat protein
MARCPACHRRVSDGQLCPSDGVPSAEPHPPAVAAEAPSLPGYQLGRCLGAGGFGAVWQARGRNGAEVAIKVGHFAEPIAIERFRREAQALWRVGPPHVPRLHATGQLPDGRPYLVMEHLYGRTLAEELAAEPTPPSGRHLEELAFALLTSVEATHRQGIVHRDLKPENVFLVGTPPSARVMDFGLTTGAAEDVRLTRTGVVLGTPEYMAPEQLSGGAVDERTDIYALGVMLFELATLSLPFTGDRAQIEHGHLALRPPRASDLARQPAALDEVLARCLAKTPVLRYATVADLRAALAAALGGAAVAAAQAGTPPPGLAPSSPAPAYAATAAGSSSVAAASSSAQRVQAGLLFLQAHPELALQIKDELESHGARLAHLVGEQLTGAFTVGAGHPVRRALAVGERLVERKLCPRLIVDVGTVIVKARPDGGSLLLSPLFTQARRYPLPGDPPGVLVSASAAELLKDVACEPVPGRPGLLLRRVVRGEPGLGMTAVRRAQGRLVGREAVLGRLVAAARSALAERSPGVATVMAEPGLGKSHLAAELVGRLGTELAGAQVIELRAPEPVAGDPDDLLGELARRSLDVTRRLTADEGRSRLNQRLGPALAEEVYLPVALILAWVPPDHESVSGLREAPGVLRYAVARAVGEALRRQAATHPLCLLLDDAQWADQTTLDALEYAVGDGQAPLWICVLGRPGFQKAHPAFGQRAGNHLVERLGALEPAAAAELCRHLLRPAEHVPASVVERLVERSQGVPMLLVDLVAGLKRDGLVQRRPSGSDHYVATELLDRLPDLPLVQWLATREIEALPADLAAHARLCSLLAAQFAAEEVEGVVLRMERSVADAFPLDARAGLVRLAQLGLLVVHRDGAYGFRHALVRDAVAGTVPEALAGGVHRAALLFYRSAEHLEEAVRLPRLAWHAARVGESAEAAATYLRLAERARLGHKYLDADLLYTRALEQLPAEAQAGRLSAHRGRGIMRYRLGRYHDAVEELGQAFALATHAGDVELEADILLDEAMALDWMGEHHQSRDRTVRTRELLGEGGSARAKARLALAEGRSAWRFGEGPRSVALLEEAARRAEPLGDAAYETLVVSLLLLAPILTLFDRLEEAEPTFERVIALCKRRQDELHLGTAVGNRVMVWYARRDARRAIEDSERCLRSRQQLGIALGECRQELNLGELHYQLADSRKARSHVGRALALAERLGADGIRGDAILLDARIALIEADLASARRNLELLGEVDRRVQEQTGQPVLLPPNQVLARMVDLSARMARDAEWEALEAEGRRIDNQSDPIEIAEMRGLALARQQRYRPALECLRRARALARRLPNLMEGRLERELVAVSKLYPNAPSR